MTQGLTLSSFGLIWLTLIVLSFGQVLIKMGVGSEKIPVCKNPVRVVLNILQTVFRPRTLAGFFLYVVGTFIWLMVLSRVSLSIAFPLFSMSYFLVVILSATILHERVEWRFAITGLVLISIGVTFIGLSSPPSRSGVRGQRSKIHSASVCLASHSHAEPVEASREH
jgi:drug/metabolite transporter (DMT)-like permease